ncbi:hypothetical protein O6H91_04G127500 [Diphasiastrum complanatum]|uniref:Uncharacterized protein n=1 Tax=Diphasiastrum complanatum TaxID=34168 RepID=A0ACC2E1S2_DIPCM|nr:hypothetical protein O6H91_04G127500 [Diphasiastrum complanatum]
MAGLEELLQHEWALYAGVALALAAVAAGTLFIYGSSKPKKALDPEQWVHFRLVKRTQVSHNVVKFRFGLQTPTTILGLPIGQHISCLGKDAAGEEVIKPYTPTTLDSDVGHFELVVKLYPQGRMSYHFSQLKVGDTLACKGPKGRFKYHPNQVRAYGMLAGGSGITPMFQVTRAILENPKDETKVYLIYANVTLNDILLKDELDGLAKNFPGRLHVFFVLNAPPVNWSGGVGFVSQDMIKANCPAPAQDIQILRCGPPPMNKAMASHLDALGYTKDMQFQF